MNPFEDRVYVIDKAPGPTSFDVVAAMRRATGIRRVGHAGTLDPLARGILLVCTGHATRAVEHFMDLEKEYAFEIRLGVETTTLDSEGDVVREAPVPDFTRARLDEVAASFVGEYLMTPPAFSALKRGGRRLSDIARSGEALEAPEPRLVNLYAFDVVGVELPIVSCVVRCSRGTYIRSLARDFGDRLGLPASIQSLTRTRIGEFGLDTAFSSERLFAKDVDDMAGRTLGEALHFLPGVVLTAKAARMLAFGMIPLRTDVVEAIGTPRAGVVRLLDEAHAMIAIGMRDGERARDPLRLVDSFRLFVDAGNLAATPVGLPHEER